MEKSKVLLFSLQLSHSPPQIFFDLFQGLHKMDHLTSYFYIFI